MESEQIIQSARALLRAGRVEEMWLPLAQAAKSNSSPKLLRQIDRLLRQAAPQPVPAKRRCRVAILSSFTVETLVPILRAQCFGMGIDASFYTGPFNQIFQEIQTESSGLAEFRPEVVVIAADWRWLGLADETADSPAAIDQHLEMLERLWSACRERWGAYVFQCNFEVPGDSGYGPLSASLAGGRGRVLRRLNLELLNAAERSSGVTVLDVEQAAAEFGKRRWFDPVMWQVARQYPAAEALPVFGNEIAVGLRALYGLTAKCAVLDLDNTLWGGVIGEDGLNGIRLGGNAVGEAFVDFQRYWQSVSRTGVLLAVCSKNNEADALQPFREHPEMVLRESDIACFRANWQPKEENLREIARTLNIGTDALVFVDDSPVEGARVRQYMPEVEVVELPADPALYATAVARYRLFDKLSLTTEDRARTGSIQQNSERLRMASAAGDVDEYLAALEMRVQLAPFDEVNLPRIVQLINKTNQFNVTTRRRTEGEVRKLMEQGWYTQAMRVTDRLGDSGLTGVLMAVAEGETLWLDSWLMSCRVLGRKLDEVMFSALVEYARRNGFQRVQCEFIPTAKNEVVRGLFERLGCDPAGADGESLLYEWPGTRPMRAPSVVDLMDLTQTVAMTEVLCR